MRPAWRMKFLCDAERCIECNGWSPRARTANECLGREPPARRHAERRRSRRTLDLWWPACTARCAVHGGCARSDCFYKTEEASSCTQDLASAAAIASTPARSPPPVSAGRHLRHAGRWTSAPFCAGARRRTTRREFVPKYRLEPPRAGQAAGVRRDVLDQGPARRDGDVIADIYGSASWRAAKAPRSGLGQRVRQDR